LRRRQDIIQIPPCIVGIALIQGHDSDNLLVDTSATRKKRFKEQEGEEVLTIMPEQEQYIHAYIGQKNSPFSQTTPLDMSKVLDLIVIGQNIKPHRNINYVPCLRVYERKKQKGII
jgi:hypothetical protein